MYSLKIIIILILLNLGLNAEYLELTKGEIKSHTEVFGDNEIDNISNEINSKLEIQNTIESIRGDISINSISLKSTNKNRDKDMYELLNVTLHPHISLNIKNIIKVNERYQITGILTLNAVSKEISSQAIINSNDETLDLEGNFSIKLSDYNMKAPKLLFFKVRNLIDISYKLIYERGK